MATGKPPDRRRWKSTHPHATNFKTANKEKHPGWIAGELYGCQTHRTFAAQPCAFDVTDGALQCMYCQNKLESTWRGYVPIWDRDYCLRYCLIGEPLFESVSLIPWRAQVVISRAAPVKSPLVIREEVTMVRALPDKLPWSAPINMLDVCLTLWRHDELAQWLRVHGAEKPKIDPQTDPRVSGYSPVMRAAAQKVLDKKAVKPIDDEVSRLLAHVKKKVVAEDAGSNGKHG